MRTETPHLGHQALDERSGSGNFVPPILKQIPSPGKEIDCRPFVGFRLVALTLSDLYTIIIIIISVAHQMGVKKLKHFVILSYPFPAVRARRMNDELKGV